MRSCCNAYKVRLHFGHIHAVKLCAEMAAMQDKARAGHQGGAVDESLDRTNTETPAAAPNVPKRARPRGKTGRR